MNEKQSYDPACQDLAEHFLADEPTTRDSPQEHMARVRSLSVAIQTAVEDWLDAAHRVSRQA